MAFKLKSGNKPSFKMMGSKPYKRALVGDQHELPDHLKQEILNAPPLKQTKDIIGEDTFSAEANKNKNQLELGLSTTGGSADPAHTNERLIVKPEDNLLDNRGNKLSEGGFIEQFEPLTIQKDSTSVGGIDYYSIKPPLNQKEAAKVAGKAALEGAKKLAPKAVEKQIQKMLGGGATDSEIRKYVKSTGTGDKYEYNWDNVTQRVESHPLKKKKKTKTEYEGRARINDDVGVANYKKGFYEKQGKRGTKGTAVTVVEGSDEARLERYGPGRKRHKDKVISKKRAERIMRRKGKSHSPAKKKEGKYKVETSHTPGQDRISFTNKRGKTVGYTATEVAPGSPDYTVTKTKGGKTKEISNKKYKRQISRKLNNQRY